MNVFKTDAATWTKEKMTAVEGYTPGTCTAWDRSFINVIVADYAQGCGIPKDQVYDAVTNPKGARCTMWDTNVASFGRDPKTGFARRSLDNVGVQYGLKAFNSGAITAAEFIDLNRKVGGFDNDGHIRAERTAADPEAVRLAYATGRLDSAAGGLGSLPILHYRSYNDPLGDIHTYERDFTMRERLRKANGRVDNQVIWIYPNGAAGVGATVTGLAIDTMSRWLDALAKDTSSAPAIEKVVRAKPADGRRRLLHCRGREDCGAAEPHRHRPLRDAVSAARHAAARRRRAAGRRSAEVPAEADRRKGLQGRRDRRADCSSCVRCFRAACVTTRRPASTRCVWVARIRSCRSPRRAGRRRRPRSDDSIIRSA